MKLLKVLSVVLLLFSNCAMAQTEIPLINGDQSTPTDTSYHQVDVTFMIDSNGQAKVLDVDSENPELIQFVLQKFEKINVKNDNYFVGKTMRYRFRFKMDPKDVAQIHNSISNTSLIATFATDAEEEGHPHIKS